MNDFLLYIVSFDYKFSKKYFPDKFWPRYVNINGIRRISKTKINKYIVFGKILFGLNKFYDFSFFFFFSIQIVINFDELLVQILWMKNQLQNHILTITDNYEFNFINEYITGNIKFSIKLISYYLIFYVIYHHFQYIKLIIFNNSSNPHELLM